MPKLQYFSRKIEDGYMFLETFMAQTQGINKTTKIKAFKALFGAPVVFWL